MIKDWRFGKLISRPMRASLVLFCLCCVVAAMSVTAIADETKPSPPKLSQNPFAAHNAYPWRFYRPGRFERALDAGLKYLEVDVTYDPKRKRVVATHDGKPRGGEPELGKLLEPLWKRWGESDQRGYTLIIDFKTTSTELARGLQAIIEPHAELLSTMQNGEPKSFQEGKITVCLTGSDRCQVLYAEAIGDGGRLLAFGDYGCSDWRKDADSYVPKQPPDFDRFLTCNITCFRRSPEARGIDSISDKRLRRVALLARQRGYRMRVYTINPATGEDGKLKDKIWRQCVEAGVPMISTDRYKDSRDWWQRYVREHQ